MTSWFSERNMYVFQLVMSNLQAILENVDTPELLCQNVKCILQVAHCYPHVFSINFRVSLLLVNGFATPFQPLLLCYFTLLCIGCVDYFQLYVLKCVISPQDTVDILVGWHIDHTQKQAVTQRVSGY